MGPQTYPVGTRDIHGKRASTVLGAVGIEPLTGFLPRSAKTAKTFGTRTVTLYLSIQTLSYSVHGTVRVLRRACEEYDEWVLQYWTMEYRIP